jgi:hypothetical protein
MLSEWLIANREVLKIVYALVICAICVVVVLKTNRLFKLSDYQGLRYFRNAFFFYGLAFGIRYFLGPVLEILGHPLGGPTMITALFEFFVVLAGFFLFYSFIWKYVEKRKNYHSLFNLRVGIFYLVSILIVFLNYSLNTELFMYFSQIALFLVMVVLSYQNYLVRGRENKFSKYYFFTIILGLLVWILNTVQIYVLSENGVAQIYVPIINVIFFLLFLYGAINISKK